uniref:beta strand repeat-containing protein n=1 Tax=Gynuella sp. TaxID=2969146 RepID=UPI003D130004
DTATLDATAPSGHSVSFDDSAINTSEASSQSFTFASAEVGASYSYSISSSGGGTPVTGSGTLSTATDQITGLDLSGLSDGTLTLSVVLTDTAGNAATAATDTATLDTTAPSGHSVSFDDSAINTSEASSQSFTFAGAEVGASYSYSISSSGGGTPVTGSGTVGSATDQITGLDLSGLSDGTLTLSVVLTDTVGNAATAVTDTTTLDSTAPSGHSVSLDNSTYNATDAASASFTFASAEVGATYSYSISSSGGGTPVTGSGTLSTATDQITGVDISGLSDGTLTLSVVVTDVAGNAATAVTDTAILDAATPSGYSVSVDDTVLNATEATNLSFTFAGAEVGATYSYSISSDGGGSPVTGSGALSSATQQVTGIDVSGLSDGTLTISVTLTDTSGNTGAAATATAALDRTAPTLSVNSGLTLKTGYTKTISASLLSATDAVSSSLTFTLTSVPTHGSLKRSGNVLANSDTFTQADLDTGVISYTDIGGSSDSFSFSVADAAGNSLSGQTFSLTIDNTNTVPTISGNPDITVAEDSAYSFIPTATDSDGDTLTFSISNQPLWADFDSSTGALTGTPVNGDVGSYSNIVISVSDGTASVSLAAFGITVTNVNDAPVIVGTPSTTAEVGVPYSFEPNGSDVDIGDTLTFSISNPPSWASFNTSTGALTGTPASGDEDTYSDIVISVSDGTASTSLPPFNIAVVVATDTDGDNVPDYQEAIDGTDPTDPEDYLDTTDPDISAPDDVVFDSTGLYTVISLPQLLGLDSDADTSAIDAALATLVSDNIDGDGCCEPSVVGMVNNAVLLPPGLNYVTWQATDHKGNTGSVDQIVRIRPLVSFGKDKTVVEGAPARFKVILNGTAPDYPFSVPVIIDTANSTADSSDHDLSDTLVVFTSNEISKTIAFNINTDSTFEGTEILKLKLDDQTSDSDDLSGGYDPDNIDIYDINSGVKKTMSFFLVEGNVAPEVTLDLQQNGSSTILVTPDGGNATVTATVVDPNAGDTFTYSWSASASSLVDTEDDSNEATFEFDPTVLKAGRYRLQLAVTDSEGASDTARLYFRVVEAKPTLVSTTDSDGDGHDDATEGTGDSDDDGIPDYLDNIVATNVLPEQARVTDSYLLECDPGVLCRLGQFAMMGEDGGARLSEDDLNNQDDLKTDDDFDFKGGIFDFEIQELPTLGQTVRIVLPLTEAIPENAVYRKYQNGEWSTFVEDANNEIHSAPGRLGYCPPPGDDSWVMGMQPGYYCVQLTIEDGGANDADGLVNAAVEDPGAVAVVKSASATQGSGWSGAIGAGLLTLLGVLLLGLRNRNSKSPSSKR